jgi:hypothetical protein
VTEPYLTGVPVHTHVIMKLMASEDLKWGAHEC